jgi:hypothetical protein
MSLSAVLAPLPVVSLLISFAAAAVSFRGWRDSREKLRLDLYNRRFEVYTRILDFYQELVLWNDKPEQFALVKPFITASREARFIFPSDSGIYEHIQAFAKRAFSITRFTENAGMLRGSMEPKDFHDFAMGRVEDTNWILTSLDTLELLMKHYMSFERL